MRNNKPEIPYTTMKKIMHKNGAERISKEAIKETMNATEEYIRKITETSERFALSARRTTIKKQDIIEAKRIIT